MFRPSRFSKNHEGPDFICVGMQKAGTGFLFDCLGRMSDFRLPVRKEMHHFDDRKRLHPGGQRLLEQVVQRIEGEPGDPQQLAEYYRQLQAKLFRQQTIGIGGRKIKLDKANVGFFRNLQSYVEQGGSDEAYLKLYEPYRGYVTGDITPAYSKLKTEKIERIHQLLPATRIILCVREPVARLWSQLNMYARRCFKAEFNRQPGADDVEKFERILSMQRLEKIVEKDRYMLRSLTTDVYRKWGEVFGYERLLVINFEDLTQKTGPVLDKISDFFELKRHVRKKIPRNKKENNMKIRIDDERRELLNSVLSNEKSDFNRLFDEHRDRV